MDKNLFLHSIHPQPKNMLQDEIRCQATVFKKPNIKKIESFIIPKQTGINYKPGIWHFPLISTKNMNFLVIDRKGIGNNLVIHNFENEKISLKFK